MGAAALLDRDTNTVGEQEAVITLTALKAAGGAAFEARESRTGSLAGVHADGIVAVGRALERCGERRQGRVTPPQDAEYPVHVPRTQPGLCSAEHRSDDTSEPCPQSSYPAGHTATAENDRATFGEEQRPELGCGGADRRLEVGQRKQGAKQLVAGVAVLR